MLLLLFFLRPAELRMTAIVTHMTHNEVLWSYRTCTSRALAAVRVSPIKTSSETLSLMKTPALCLRLALNSASSLFLKFLSIKVTTNHLAPLQHHSKLFWAPQTNGISNPIKKRQCYHYHFQNSSGKKNIPIQPHSNPERSHFNSTQQIISFKKRRFQSLLATPLLPPSNFCKL